MKKFKFRLQTVLDIKEKKLEEKQLELAKVLTLLDAQKEALNGMNESYNHYDQGLLELMTAETIDVFSINSNKAYLLRLAFDMKMQRQIIEKTEILLREKQIEVNLAYQDMKILEKLKEKAEKRHYRHFEELQVKEIDDITTSRYCMAS